MKRSIEKVAIPLDWLWPLKISKFIHELHSRDFEEIDRKVRAVLSPVFALIPELTISGALENRINPSTHREEVFYQPVLIASRQLQLPFDANRSATLEATLKSCLEEFARLPMMLERCYRPSNSNRSNPYRRKNIKHFLFCVPCLIHV